MLTKDPPKTIGYRRAIELMRKPGTRLIKMASGRAIGGVTYYVTPGAQVEADVAEKIKQHPLVRASHDGLWPGHDQTWRMVE